MYSSGILKAATLRAVLLDQTSFCPSKLRFVGL